MNNNTKGLIFLITFKLSNFFTKNQIFKIIGFPIRIMYKIIIQWLLGIDINDTLRFGENFQVFHGQGLVIHSSTQIGNNVTVRQNTTIGVAKDGGKCPIIMDNVDIGANSVIIGDIIVGHNSIIAAGSIVVKDVPPFSLVGGNPARIIKSLNK